MLSNPRVQTLLIALIALEYALADFNATAPHDDSDEEMKQLDAMISVLAEANRELLAALGAIGRDHANDWPDHHSDI